ncbi:MAG TPA: ethanolamine utilization protein EutJ [Proteiniclasticum sp.]|nr:ethanolamine utilization protein EutJ [Proteiniclasticum sp.]
MDIMKVNHRIKAFEEIIFNKEKKAYQGELYTGVDLGTASIVLCVVDEKGSLVSGAFERCNVVRDGIVVDFMGACEIVKRLKKQLEDRLGAALLKSCGAIPPGVTEGSSKVVRNVLEAAGFQVLEIVDEPTAAAEMLEVSDGAVVDIGGGTTGISILRDGAVVSSYDEATGGHHMNLVISGSYGISYEDAEKMKCTKAREEDVYRMVLPVIDKMALIVKKFINGQNVSQVYLVGGGSTLKGFEEHFESSLGIKTIKPYNPMLVTPMGIALCALKERKP